MTTMMAALVTQVVTMTHTHQSEADADCNAALLFSD